MHPPANLLTQNSSTQNLGQATVGDVVFTLDKPDLPDLGSRSFTDSMVASAQMLLVQLGLGNGGTIGDTLVVTPHDGWAIDWHPHHAKLVAKLLDQFLEESLLQASGLAARLAARRARRSSFALIASLILLSSSQASGFIT